MKKIERGNEGERKMTEKKKKKKKKKEKRTR